MHVCLIAQFSSVTQLCRTLCDPMDCGTSGFPVHHQLLELAQTHVHQVGDSQLCPTLCEPMDCSRPGSSVHGDYPGKKTGVGCHTLLQGIYSSQRSNHGLLHCSQRQDFNSGSISSEPIFISTK